VRLSEASRHKRKIQGVSRITSAQIISNLFGGAQHFFKDFELSLDFPRPRRIHSDKQCIPSLPNFPAGLSCTLLA
jgi:hypothetical protein